MDATLTHLDAFLDRMKEEGMPDLAARSFAYYYQQLVRGETGMIAESSIEPAQDIPDYEKLASTYRAAGERELAHTAMLKLNGGLGTSMGLKRAKSLLAVREEQTFLDVIAQQAIHWDVSLLLMNSFSTADDSRDKIADYPDLKRAVPLDFIQHKIPKVNQETLEPVRWPTDVALEWCPPGHGDLYIAMVTTGMLAELRNAGIKYVFVSNSDNLGAVIDPLLLGYFAKHNLPFLMEVADRTAADRKGGHLAVDPSGGFLLRESAQCPADDTGHFQNIDKHRYFNTNNLWINLEALAALIEKTEGILGLPMIRNSKTVDPRDGGSTPVYQLETAMGAAIAVFEGAGAVRVPRTRFAPVKTTNELLAVRSDAYQMNKDFTLALIPEREGRPCAINLDRTHYKTVDALAEKFPHGSPSLKDCQRLEVVGDVRFGKNIVCRGNVTITNNADQPKHIEDGTVLDGVVVFS
ncbi:MAG: UTP--glucose-1-phosphate uridylyltransferase [Bacteroidota bacterium]